MPILSFSHRFYCGVLFCIVLGAPAPLLANNICKEIQVDPKTETLFIHQQTREYFTTQNGKKLRYVSPAPFGGGSCVSESAGVSRDGGELEEVELGCYENGCNFGLQLRIVPWNSQTFVLGKNYDSGIFERLKGWKNLSSEEKDRIKFRNLASDLYLVSPDNAAKTKIVCERSYTPEAQKWKSLSTSKFCISLAKDKTTSIFPKKSDPGKEIQIDMHTYYDPSQKVKHDLNADGQAESFVPVLYASGAGCGCDRGSILFLDEKNQPITDQKGLVDQFSELATDQECGDWLDIFVYKGQYYVERENGSRLERIHTREIYPLTGKRAFEQVCGFVNDTPLNWESR